FGPAIAAELRAGRTVAVTDIAEDPRTRPPETQQAYAGIATRALLDVPLVKDGRILGMLFIHQDTPRAWSPAEVTLVEECCERLWAAAERARAEAALRESRRQLIMALDAAHMGSFEWDLATDRLSVTGGAADIFGLDPRSRLDTVRDALALLHPEDRARHREACEAASRGGGDYRSEYRIIRPRDGRVAWIEERGSLRRDPVTGALRMTGTHADVTERKQAEERQALLAREVDHRAKNALAVVQTMLRLTRADDIGSFVRAVEGRIAALARAQTLLAQQRWHGADLGTLLRGELAPFLAGQRAELDGPVVVLPAGTAQPLAMAVHELATNAAKHGALSVPGGMVAVRWRLEGTAPGRLLLHWAEAGGPPVPGPPARRGFGSRVLEGTVRSQLGGRVTLDWARAGLACEVMVPLDGTRGSLAEE
ncbi:HWE histidine kinase domain-containing protein, partial [Paracraurococcus ruber]